MAGAPRASCLSMPSDDGSRLTCTRQPSGESKVRSSLALRVATDEELAEAGLVRRSTAFEQLLTEEVTLVEMLMDATGKSGDCVREEMHGRIEARRESGGAS